MKNEYLITMEWNEGEFIADGFPKYYINAYCGSSEYCSSIEEWMFKASPYDYCDREWYENEQDWREDVQYWIAKGVYVRIIETHNEYK